MKVKIGKCPHWFSVRRVEDKYLEWRFNKPAWDVDDREYETIDHFVVGCLDVWQTVLHYTVNRIQGWRKQKVQVHVDPWDVWNADSTLAYVIFPVLERLKETKQGAPFVDNKDVPKNLRAKKKQMKETEETGRVDDNHFARWEYILDAMIWSFREMAEDKPGEEEFFTGESDIKWTPVDEDGNEVSEEDRKYYRMDKGPNDTSRIDMEGLKAYEERIDFGLRMFGKYYRGLWN